MALALSVPVHRVPVDEVAQPATPAAAVQAESLRNSRLSMFVFMRQLYHITPLPYNQNRTLCRVQIFMSLRNTFWYNLRQGKEEKR